MRTANVSALAILLVMSLTLAYGIARSLMTEFQGGLTYVDLGTMFVLGALCGMALCSLVVIGRSGHRNASRPT